MRKLFTLCLLVFSLSASAQWQQTGSKVRYVNGLGIPTKDTAAGVAADSSQILIRPADSSLYVKYKRTWLRVGGGGGSIAGSGTTNYIPKFTSSSAIGNSQIFDNGTNVGIGTVDFGASGLSFSNVFNLSFSEGSGASYANIFRQRNTAATVIAHSLKRSGTANFASSFTGSIGKAAVAVGFDNGSISFFSDPPSNVANGTDFTASERMRITSAGDVGIGTTSPAGRFVVADGQTLLGTNTNNGVDRLQVSGSMNVSARATAQNLSVVGTTSTTGNVGIFNSAPFYALSVGDGTSTRQVVINGLNSGTAGGSSIAVQTNSSTTIMFGNKSNVIGGAYDGQPVFGFGGSTNSLQFYNFNTLVTSAMISSGDRFLIGTTTDNNTDKLQVNGSISGIGMKQAYVTKTGAYTATDADYVIDCTSGTFTVTLPASSGRTGRILIIKNSGAGTITVDGNAAETIDGAATYSLATQYATVQIMSDGTNWKIISKF